MNSLIRTFSYDDEKLTVFKTNLADLKLVAHRSRLTADIWRIFDDFSIDPQNVQRRVSTKPSLIENTARFFNN